MLQSVVDKLVANQGGIARVFVLHWAQDVARDISWANKRITLPPCDKIGERDVPEFPDGEPIPGAVLVFDEHGEDEQGNSRVMFDALRAVYYFLQINPRRVQQGKNKDGTPKYVIQNGEPKSALYRAGLSVLPYPCTREQLRASFEEAQIRLAAFNYDNALRTIHEYDSKNAARVAAGMPTVSGGKPYADAVRFKAEYEAAQEEKDGLRGELIVANPEAEEEELEFLIFAKARVQALVEKTNVGPLTSDQKAAIVKEYLEDDGVRSRLQKQYRIRKKGYSEAASFKDPVAVGYEDLGDNAPVPNI